LQVAEIATRPATRGVAARVVRAASTTTTLGSRKATETLLYARQEIRI
jgi:hypothetical protein